MQPLLEPLQVVRSRPITRAESKLLSALVEPEVSQLRSAERGRTLENRFEHGSDVRRRTRDNAQNLAVCCSRDSVNARPVAFSRSRLSASCFSRSRPLAPSFFGDLRATGGLVSLDLAGFGPLDISLPCLL